MDEILWFDHSNETSSVVLTYGTITVGYVVLTFKSVDGFLWFDHSNETSSAVLLRNTVYCTTIFMPA